MTEGTGVPRDCRVERLEQKLAEVKQLYKQKYGEEVDQEDTDVQYDADGTPWIQISGTGVATDLRVERLEQLLSTVKDLYSEKYGRDVDTEYDADGTPWKVTEGTGVPRDCRVERLEQKLSEVKQLYKQKYGEEVDQEDTDVQYDAEGTPWKVTEGTGVPRDCRVERLEQKLAEVKQLYKQKYGEEVDQEDTDVQYDAEGTPWKVTEGTGVPRDCRVERLEQKLAEVKQLYKQKYGEEVDQEDPDVQYDAEGTPWKVTEGTGVSRDCRVERLEQKLAEVKQLYKQKYGEEVDQEDTDVQYDAEGTPWKVTEGTGVPRDCRVERLEQKLAEVKQLYKQKYGEEVDQEDTDVQYDAEGTPWKVTEGTGVPRDCRVERLEQKLAEVKQLYKQNYGKEVDENDEMFSGDFTYDSDGTLWIKSTTTGIELLNCFQSIVRA